MQPYLFSLLAGVGIGVVYALLRVRSPAPPVIALVGLLGMLGGEWVVHEAKVRFLQDVPAITLSSPVNPR
jgi:XapX domain-containing protein